MSLRKTRCRFTECLARLILWLIEHGYGVAIGQDGLKHMDGSLHYVGLADDLYLYNADGVYLTATEDYRAAGEYWKTLDPLARWGGDFRQTKDGNHFSFEWEGKR